MRNSTFPSPLRSSIDGPLPSKRADIDLLPAAVGEGHSDCVSAAMGAADVVGDHDLRER